MRKILSLSLPQQAASKIKTLSKKRGFACVSGYIKYLIESDQDLISNTELLNSVREARKEYKTGKTIKAKSIADLV